MNTNCPNKFGSRLSGFFLVAPTLYAVIVSAKLEKENKILGEAGIFSIDERFNIEVRDILSKNNQVFYQEQSLHYHFSVSLEYQYLGLHLSLSLSIE